MNAKGVESIPFSFLISLIVLVLVITAGFFMVDSLNSFNSKSSLYNSILRLRDRIDFLKTGDTGSFSHQSIVIPSGFFIVFEGSSVGFGNSTSKQNIPVNAVFNNSLTLNKGKYNLVLCYGDCEETDYLIEFI
jgi:hypothetical protein